MGRDALPGNNFPGKENAMFRDALEGTGAFDPPTDKERTQRTLQYIWCRPALDEVVALTAAALHREVDDVLTQDVYEHLDQADEMLSVYQGSTLVGYMLLTFPLEGLVYIAGTMVDPKFHGVGIKARATQVVMNRHSDRRYFAGRTQSSIVWASVTRSAKVVLPSTQGREVESEMVEMRQRLVEGLGMDDAIHEGFYGGPLYGEKPTHRDEAVQAWWDTFINFERGDAVLYIARL